MTRYLTTFAVISLTVLCYAAPVISLAAQRGF